MLLYCSMYDYSKHETVKFKTEKRPRPSTPDTEMLALPAEMSQDRDKALIFLEI